MFDPNIFYCDDELRKQVPKMAGHFVYTGQEKPTGSRQPIREFAAPLTKAPAGFVST